MSRSFSLGVIYVPKGEQGFIMIIINIIDIMSIIENGASTVTFASDEDKKKTLSYLIDSNIPFRGVSLNSIVIPNRDIKTLKKQGIKFT